MLTKGGPDWCVLPGSPHIERAGPAAFVISPVPPQLIPLPPQISSERAGKRGQISRTASATFDSFGDWDGGKGQGAKGKGRSSEGGQRTRGKWKGEKRDAPVPS